MVTSLFVTATGSAKCTCYWLCGTCCGVRYLKLTNGQKAFLIVKVEWIAPVMVGNRAVHILLIKQVKSDIKYLFVLQAIQFRPVFKVTAIVVVAAICSNETDITCIV